MVASRGDRMAIHRADDAEDKVRQEFTMTQAQLDRLLAACRPRPVMCLSGGMPMGPSVQESANDAWAALGDEMGFDGMTVQPTGKGDRIFTAEPKAERRKS